MDTHEKKALDETGGKSIYLVHYRIDHQDVKPIIDAIEKIRVQSIDARLWGRIIECSPKAYR